MRSASERLAYTLQARALQRDAEALPDIHRGLSDADPQVRAGATRALSYFSGPEIPDRLLPLLQDIHPAVRSAAVWGLTRQGPGVAPKVRRFLKSASGEAHRQARRVLRTFEAQPASKDEPVPSLPVAPAPVLSEVTLMTAVHDLRGLGMGIGLLLGEAASDPALPSSSRGRINRALAVVDTLQLVLRSLLDERAPNAGRPLAAHSVFAVLEEAIRTATPIFEAHGVRLQVDTPTRDSVVELDKTGTLRAVCNLLWNACRHSPEGTTVTLSTEWVDDAMLAIQVEDEGPGIPLDRRRALTEAFERGEGTREEGWGLGLFIVSEVCRRHGGRVDIDEGAAGGARIRMLLPRRRASALRSA